MYRLQLHHADVWSILDEREEEVFRGSLAECESWLDAEERRAAAETAETRLGIANWFRHWWRRASLPLLPEATRAATKEMPQHP